MTILLGNMIIDYHMLGYHIFRMFRHGHMCGGWNSDIQKLSLLSNNIDVENENSVEFIFLEKPLAFEHLLQF